MSSDRVQRSFSSRVIQLLRMLLNLVPPGLQCHPYRLSSRLYLWVLGLSILIYLPVCFHCWERILQDGSVAAVSSGLLSLLGRELWCHAFSWPAVQFWSNVGSLCSHFSDSGSVVRTVCKHWITQSYLTCGTCQRFEKWLSWRRYLPCSSTQTL